MTIAAIAPVQATWVGLVGTITVPSCAVGDPLILICTDDNGSGAIETITDTASDTWGTPAVSVLDTVEAQRTRAYVINTAGSGSVVITVTMPAGSTFYGAACVRCTGGATSGALVGKSGNYQNSPATTADAVTSLTAAPTAWPALALAFAADNNTNHLLTVGTGYTSLANGLNVVNAPLTINAQWETKRVTTSAAVAGTFTATTSGESDSTLLVLVAELGAAGGAHPNSLFFGAGTTS